MTAVAANLIDDSTRSLFRQLLAGALQELIEDELTARIGAGLHERTATRTNQRNGHRPRTLSTPAGDVELAIPKTRTGSFFPSLLEPRRRVDRALWAVIMTATSKASPRERSTTWSRRWVWIRGVSKSTVSRICAELDEQIAAFRQRRLDHATFPYVFCDATYVKARSLEGRVVSRAVIAAFGVAADGTREVLGVDVGDSEDETSRRRPRMQVVEQHREHQPIRVYDALELDEHRRPTRWLYHVECLNCGQQFVPPPDADDQ